ncbi:MAG TPA: TonB-dependent receptor [bacterium]|nr:TonB-dependent receptor [bacterium]
MKRTIFLVIVAFCLPALSLGDMTGSLRGKVYNQMEGNPLPEVKVMVLETRQSVFTDSAGSYQLSNIRAGTYTLQYFKPGFQSAQYNRVVFLPDVESILHVVLHPLTGQPASAGPPAVRRGAGTGVLRGRVTDRESQMPLSGVNVYLLDTYYGAITDEQGYYRIPGIPAGDYTLVISRIGYEQSSEPITVEVGATGTVSAALVQTPLQGSEVQVVADAPILQQEITGTTFHVSEDEVLMLPVDNVEQVLTLQPGVTTEGHVRGGRTREVMYLMDGLTVQNELQGEKGMQIPKTAISQVSVKTGGYDVEYGNALSGIVNVITKSGTNEHHVLVRADRDDTDRLYEGTEHSRTQNVEVTLDGPVIKDKMYYFTANALRLSDTRWWQDMEKYFDSPVSRSSYGIAKLDYTFTPSKRLGTQFLYSLREWRDYEFSWRFNLDGLPQRQEQSYRGAVFWSHTFSERAFYNVKYSYYFLRSRIGSGTWRDLSLEPYQYDFYLRFILDGDQNWWADSSQRTHTLKLTYNHQLTSRHALKTGFDFSYYDVSAEIRKLEPQRTYFGKPLLHRELLNYSTDYRYHPYSGSAFIQDKIKFGEGGDILNLGLRFDFLDPRAQRPAVEFIPTTPDSSEYGTDVEYVPAKVKYNFSPRVGGGFPLTADTYLFLNIGQYYQFPLFDYLYSGIDNVKLARGTNVLKGNPDLLAERTTAFELSIRHKISDYTMLSAAFYKKETHNQIDTKTWIPTDVKYAGDYGFAEYVNNPFAQSQGLELVVTKEQGQLFTGNISYSFMVAKGLTGTEQTGVEYAQWPFDPPAQVHYLSWDQRHTLKLDGQVYLPHQLTASLVGELHTGRPFTYYPSRDGFTTETPGLPFKPNNDRMAAYSRMDMKIRKQWQIKGWIDLTTYLDVRNVFDQRNVKWVDSSGRVGGELGDPSGYYTGRRTYVGFEAAF